MSFNGKERNSEPIEIFSSLLIFWGTNICTDVNILAHIKIFIWKLVRLTTILSLVIDLLAYIKTPIKNTNLVYFIKQLKWAQTTSKKKTNYTKKSQVTLFYISVIFLINSKPNSINWYWDTKSSCEWMCVCLRLFVEDSLKAVNVFTHKLQ